MNLTFDPTNEDELFMVREITTHLCLQHADPGREMYPLFVTEGLRDPLTDAGTPPPPPPPGAPEIEPDNTEQNASITPDADGVVTLPGPAGGGGITSEVDNAGVPWDARIHSSGKTFKKDNSWVRRRGVDDATYQRVVAEITAAPAAAVSQPPAASVPPPPPAAVAAPPSATPPPPPAAAVAEPEFNGDSAGKWQDIVQKVMLAKVGEQITMEQVDGKATELGVTGGFLNMVSRPDLFDAFDMWLMEQGV